MLKRKTNETIFKINENRLSLHRFIINKSEVFFIRIVVDDDV